MKVNCPTCGEEIIVGNTGRPRTYCSNACRQAGYRSRSIPRAMLSAQRWVCHVDKRPVTPSGTPASTTDPSTWSSYADVCASPIDSIGFVLGDGFACLDIDHCIEGGKVNGEALAVLRKCSGAYVEISPSGTGLHVWGTASPCKGHISGGVEAYSAGRYITITRDVYSSGSLVDLSRFF